jgi:AcrR family transcriptional regulator
LSGNGFENAPQIRDFLRRVQPNVKHMAHKKPDRRTERTRHALMTAFVNLVLSRGYESLGVEDIVDAANVGRSTFYLHYKSKEHLLRESVSRPSAALSLIVGHDIATEIIVFQLNHFHEQRVRNRTFFAEPVRSIWAQCLAGMIEPRLASLVRQAHARPLLPLNLIATQIAEAQIALVAHWLVSRSPVKVEAVADALISATRASVTAYLGTRPGTPLFIANEKIKILRHP